MQQPHADGHVCATFIGIGSDPEHTTTPIHPMNSATFSSSLARLQALPWAAYGTRTVAGLRACCLAAQLLAMAVAIGAAIAYEHRQQIRDAAIAAIAAVVVAAQATYHAGRRTRRLWDQLVAFSERMGRWYSSLLVGTTTAPAAAAPAVLPTAPATAPVALPAAPVAAPAVDLSGMTCAELRQLLGVKRRISKAALLQLAAKAIA